MCRKGWAAFVVPVVILSLAGNCFPSTPPPAEGAPSGRRPVSGDAMETEPEKAKTYAVESPFSLDMPKLLLRDTARVLSAPARWDGKDWARFSLLTGSIAAAALADTSVRSWVLHNQNGEGSRLVDNFHQYGTYYAVGAMGLFYGAGALLDDPEARAVAIDGAAAALVAAGIITPGLKYVVGRARPSAEKGPHYFTPFSSENASFPSGEATGAFAVASVIASHYDEPWIKIASYAMAGLIGLGRIYHDQHWTSDVLAGALIGSAVGMAVVRFNERRRRGGPGKRSFFAAPLLSPGTAGVTINLVY